MSKALRWAVLGVVLALLLRLWVLGSGPDLDTDSYGHARIGRLAMEHPTRLAVHWVWLPLWHFVLGGAARLGLGFTAMRVVDALLAAGVPLLTFAIVARASRSRVAGSAAGTSHGVAVLAAWFAAWFPLAITHGASAEPESLFAVLVLIACAALEARRWLGCGAALALAVLLRFEAWASLPAFALAALWTARGSSVQRLVCALWTVLLPTVVIVLYTVLHALAYDGVWLAFVRENAVFVREARALAPANPNGPQPEWTWYLASLPWRTAGPVVLTALVGVVPFVRAAPRSFVCVGPWLLAFVSVGWIREQHLGLDRHFFAVIPFYATAMAEGAWLLASALQSTPARQRLLGASVLLLCGYSLYSARSHARASAASFVDERAIAVRLTEARPPPGSVHCSAPEIEVFSALAADRFADPEVLVQRAQTGAPVWVVEEHTRRARWPSSWRAIEQRGRWLLLSNAQGEDLR